ncbi:hypothetical protein SAMN04487846_1413 [Microbacterium sp. cf046]|uniref:hypothetical protein n=1 Tax=Microbacterium sp. cf046 TaxID=1761803 RepID=UPI0008F1BBD5|nr:hypothetical protein [Microbacterium sp. cf046]SFS00831.1 hypothetical protein SAMN04487846_1413 [Microbacterium sp. cf046]
MSGGELGPDDAMSVAGEPGPHVQSTPARDAPPEGDAKPEHRRTRPGAIEIIALALGAAAGLSCLLLLAPASNSPIGVTATIILALAAVLCAIVALERRGKSAVAICGVVVALIAGVFTTAAAVPAPDLYAHVYGYADAPGPVLDCPTTAPAPTGTDTAFWEGAFYATELGADGTSASEPLAFETKVFMSQTATEMPVMSMAVGLPVDVTQAAADASVPPPEGGVYLAIPVTYADPDEQAFSCAFSPAWPASWWLAESGEEFELVTVSIPDFPTLEDGGVPNPTGDSLVYYDIFDVSPEAAAGGSYYTVLLTPDASEQYVYWGGADR